MSTKIDNLTLNKFKILCNFLAICDFPLFFKPANSQNSEYQDREYKGMPVSGKTCEITVLTGILSKKSKLLMKCTDTVLALFTNFKCT